MLWLANAEYGTNGTTVQANIDFDSVNTSAASTNIYTNSAICGTLSYKSVSGTSGNGGYMAWDASLPDVLTEVWMRMYCSVPAYYAGSLFMIRWNSTNAVRVSLSSSGNIKLIDGSATTIATTTTAVALNTPFRLELHAIASASSTGGTMEVRLYTSADSTTPTETLGPFTANQTAVNFDAIWFGPWGSGNTGTTLYHDEDAASTAGWIGPRFGQRHVFLTATNESGTAGATVDNTEYTLTNFSNGATVTYAGGGNTINGQLSACSTCGTGNGGWTGWDGSFGIITEIWVRSYMNVPVFYTGVLATVRFDNSSVAKVRCNPAGNIVLQDTNSTTIGTSTTAITPGTNFRWELHLVGGAGSTSTMELRIYTNKDSATPTETLGPYTGQQTSVAYNGVWFGISAGATAGLVLYHDDDAISTIGWIGPSTFGSAPYISTV